MNTYYYMVLVSNICLTLFSFAQSSDAIMHEGDLIAVVQTLHNHPENIHKVHSYIQEYPYTITQHTYIKNLLHKELKKLIIINNTPTSATSYTVLSQKLITLTAIHGFLMLIMLPFVDGRPIEKDEDCFAEVFYMINKITCIISLGSLVELYIRTEYENRSITQCIEIIEHILKTF